MKPEQLVRSLFMRAVASPSRRKILHRGAEVRRRLSGAPHRVEYFHQVDDPYSHLAAQALSPLLLRYEIELTPHLVSEPDDAAAPERQLLIDFARRDAADIAEHFGVAFSDPGKQPAPELVRRAESILAGALASAQFGDLAKRVGAAMWSGDGPALDRIAQESPPADAADTEGRVREGTQRRQSLGHYLGAVFHYGNEWYWGVDRLGHLEGRLLELEAGRGEGIERAFAPPPETCAARGASQVTLEFFPSLRSPYTYLAMPRIAELVRDTGVNLVLRPVLPMVMRDLPVPARKGAYIIMDVAREAERLGLPFGRAVDPVGRPVERAYSLFQWARERGVEAKLMLAFARGAFAEAIDTGTNAGVRKVVESTGLRFEDAADALDSESWREEFEANRIAMYAAGLWGVPSFRVSGGAGRADYATWGQDRLFRIAQEIGQRAG